MRRKSRIAVSEIIPRPQIILDWRAYFVSFCKKHGDPVYLDGRWWFRDGWSYSATNLQGPEYGPNENKTLRANDILRYWRQRLVIVDSELRMLKDALNRYNELAASRDVPLVQVPLSWKIENGKRKRVIDRERKDTTLDLTPIRSRIDWLEKDRKVCGRHLKTEDSSKPKGRTDASSRRRNRDDSSG